MPRCKAPEILRLKETSIEAYLDVGCNKPAPCLTRGRMRETPQMGGFQQPARARPHDRVEGVLRLNPFLVLIVERFILNFSCFLILQRHIYPIPLLTSPLKGEGLENLP